MQGLLHDCAISVFTQGPMLGLMLRCHYLEIHDDSEEGAPRFDSAWDPTNQVASGDMGFVLSRITHRVCHNGRHWVRDS